MTPSEALEQLKNSLLIDLDIYTEDINEANEAWEKNPSPSNLAMYARATALQAKTNNLLLYIDKLMEE